MLRTLLLDVLIAAAIGAIGLLISDADFAWKMAAATFLGLLAADTIRRLPGVAGRESRD